jgi:DNA-binding NarL/FixJ family response regulator
MSKISVLLVDDHPVVRSGIRSLLQSAPDIELVGEAASGEEALRLVDETHPAVLILDIELPDMQGTQVARQVQEQHPEVGILVLSAHDDAAYVRNILESGAAGYLVKEEAPLAILDAVRGVARGEKGWVSRHIAARMAAWVQAGSRGKDSLTAREQQALRYIVQGLTNQAIAHEMSISEKTVEKYISAIFTKLEVASRVEAAVLAVKEGLVEM